METCVIGTHITSSHLLVFRIELLVSGALNFTNVSIVTKTKKRMCALKCKNASTGTPDKYYVINLEYNLMWSII